MKTRSSSTSVGARGAADRLVFQVEPRYGSGMSVAELIKQVKALPARKRERVFLAILALEEKSPVTRSKQTNRVAWPDVEADRMLR
jgi:hypothetical protein